MIRVDKPETKKPQWDKEITVKLTLGELAYINSVIGESTIYDDKFATNKTFGEGTYEEIHTNLDIKNIGSDVYDHSGTILEDEGVVSIL